MFWAVFVWVFFGVDCSVWILCELDLLKAIESPRKCQKAPCWNLPNVPERYGHGLQTAICLSL